MTEEQIKDSQDRAQQFNQETAEDKLRNDTFKGQNAAMVVLIKERDDLKGQVKVLREAMNALEWAGNSAQGDQGVCPDCISYPHEGHSDDCQLQAALKI